MGKILCVVNGVEKIASHSLIISLFFNNNTYGIANFINRVIIPYNVATNFSGDMVGAFVLSTLWVQT